ncbi:MAG: PilC/PilY family type IV pilus protein [Desulfobacterales bacterium]|jgi:type IV pilus assembly protein PilY1
MTLSRKNTSAIFLIFVLITFVGLTPPYVFGADYCGNDVAVPPFLSSGVDPNLLLLIDNSGSMIDLAYVETDSQCFDDTYNNTTTYAGYFERNVVYAYNFSGEYFEVYSPASHWTGKDSSGGWYYNGYVWMLLDSTPTPTAFVASGNFFNWAMASKFDIEKEILTGGKYDSSNSRLVMESRGCLDRRYIKKVQVTDHLNGGTKYLTLAIRPPNEEEFDPWENGTAYAAGDIINDFGELYIATSSGTSNGTSVDDDTGVSWSAYTLTRWTNGATYPAGSIVSDPSKSNTIDEGRLYITATGGTASGTGVDDDTGVTDWVPYNLTHIEIFPATTNGFDHSACQDAVDELAKDSPNQGQLKQYIDDCMGYSEGGGSSHEANSHAAFNHGIHNCWYKAKHGDWPPGVGVVTSTKNACEDVYSGVEPWNITPSDRGYICSGLYNGDASNPIGYVGRCWKPSGGAVLTCTKYKKDGSCQKWEWIGGTADWDAAGYADVDTCIEEAMRDYCGNMEIPEVIDPSDQASATGEFWNIPAVLVDSGVVAQLGEPLAVLNGYISKSSAPTGLLQEFDDDIRMGAMVFNAEGSKSECSQPDPFILYDCTDASNRDGGKIISDIDKSSSHTIDLVDAINDIKATSWTPLAESFYNAMGYYSQDSSLRLDSNDFHIGSGYDPITAYCQKNNILIITEGASTADLNSTVSTFVATSGQNDTDSQDSVDCGDLSGSTYLDDLTYYAKNSASLYPTQLNGEDKQNIDTHIVVAGTLRDTGNNECSPDELLDDAATHGGTSLYSASDLTQLENALREAFEAIRAGAAAGSAASVISASRRGEGAIYQAIFWPKVDLSGGNSINWIGEVHSLFVDEYGQFYEDTNGDRIMDASDQRVVIYFDESAGLTKACNGELNTDGTCNGTSKGLENVHYLWSASKWLADISDTDILVNRAGHISNVKQRYIFTWDDVDNDGIVDSNEILDFDTNNDWAALTVDATRGPVPLDFGLQTNVEVNEIVKWVRGLDQAGQRSREMPYDFDLDGTPTDVTWRLGDVVHSTPISVSRPSEGFHFLYRDTSYAQFVETYKNRRNVIYFGANDGMIHAINGGFYNETQKKFCLTADCQSESSAPELGAELWAYVPYNLLPHLKCLTDPAYEHKYFVDLHPRIFDVRIFDPTDGIHTGGWGTIMVQGMRFGGAKVLAGTLDLDEDSSPDYPADIREFTSAYVILDITDPENPPTLLGEMTLTTSGAEVDLGYTTSTPTIVTMKNGADVGDTSWYLILGNGPTNVDGTSSQNAKIAVLPLSWLAGTPTALRIPDSTPTLGNEGGTFTLTANSFVSDMISVDYELESNYKTDVVYFGTVSGDWSGGGGWGGGMYRLVTRELDSFTGDQLVTQPSDWATLISPLNNPLYLMDVGRPVTAAASVGTDGVNYWVYFGSGRFFDSDDKTDSSSNAQETYYGIKEPRDGNEFTWETVEKTGTWNDVPGAQGLLQTDNILVHEATTGTSAVLSCIDGTTNCLPTGITEFSGLENYIVGTGHYNSSHSSEERATYTTGTDGWYKEFHESRERNLGQSSLLGGLLTFTTYKPYDDVCLAEGLSYLYGVYFRTGTAWYESVFGDNVLDDNDNVIDRLDLGRGLATTPDLHVGKEEGSKAFVQTSTGTIVEIPQPNLPLGNIKTGRASWIEAE